LRPISAGIGGPSIRATTCRGSAHPDRAGARCLRCPDHPDFGPNP
jgi:hypothetical protein